MKVTREKTENKQAFLTIEMEPAELKESIEKAYKRLAKRANIPGFRKGKAPRAVLEHYLRKENVLDDALNDMIPRAYEKALKEQEIEAIGQPQIEITQTDPVIFKAIVSLLPTVELGDYHKIRIKPEKAEVTKENISDTIEQLRRQHATWEPAERAVDFGDLAVLDIESNVDGEPFINQKGAQYQVFRDSPFPAPGFAKQLEGMKKGEEKEFKLQLPADYLRNEVAGKEPVFKVKVVEIKEEILPELNDDFVKQISAELETLDSLQEEVTNTLKLRAEEKVKTDFEDKVIETVVTQAQIEFPPILTDMEIHRLIDDQSRRFQMQGGNMEEYLKSINKTEEQLHEELHPVAIKRVTRSLALGKVAEEEKVDVNESEIDADIERMLASVKEKKEDIQKIFNTPQSRESIKQILMTRKTINILVETAKDSKKPAKATKEEEK